MTNNKDNKNSLNSKLDEILNNQKIILKNEKKILGEEKIIENLENEELYKEDKNQQTEEDALKELTNLEKELKKNRNNPIKKITKRDLFKGFIGAFAGLLSHFAFAKGFELGTHLSLYQATILYLVAFFLINVMLYYTGFREVKKRLVLKFMPVRAIVLYSVSIITIIIVYILFGKIHAPYSFTHIYTVVGSSIILAVMGAGTADLIGGGEH